MTDQLPVESVGHEVVLKSVASLAKMVKGYARDRMRVRGLATFAARTNKGGLVTKKAQVQYSDRPEVEIYLTHRDDFEAISARIAKLEAKIEDMQDDPESLATCVQSIARQEEIKWRHLASMEKILAKLSDECGSREAAMVKLATDAAKLAQADAHHRERMEIEREGGEAPTAKLDRLAEKYGMSRDEVCKMLNIPLISLPDASPAAE
jgi:TolA-binding protein